MQILLNSSSRREVPRGMTRADLNGMTDRICLTGRGQNVPKKFLHFCTVRLGFILGYIK